MPEFYTLIILLINQLGEFSEKQLSVFGSKGGQIFPLMHVTLSLFLQILLLMLTVFVFLQTDVKTSSISTSKLEEMDRVKQKLTSPFRVLVNHESMLGLHSAKHFSYPVCIH